MKDRHYFLASQANNEYAIHHGSQLEHTTRPRFLDTVIFVLNSTYEYTAFTFNCSANY